MLSSCACHRLVSPLRRACLLSSYGVGKCNGGASSTVRSNPSSFANPRSRRNSGRRELEQDSQRSRATSQQRREQLPCRRSRATSQQRREQLPRRRSRATSQQRREQLPCRQGAPLSVRGNETTVPGAPPTRPTRPARWRYVSEESGTRAFTTWLAPRTSTAAQGAASSRARGGLSAHHDPAAPRGTGSSATWHREQRHRGRGVA